MERVRKENAIGIREISSSRKHIAGDYLPHFHEFYEIEYILQGTGYCMLNGETFPCGEGMLFFMTPLDSHSVHTQSAELFNVMFSQQLVDFGYLEPFVRSCRPKAIFIEPEARRFFETVLSEVVANGEDAELCGALMNCLLLKLSKLLPRDDGHTLSSAVSKMLACILSRFRCKLTLEEAAACAGLTPSYASFLFRKEMQVNFKAYLDSLRFEHARKLLVSSELSVAGICEESGFEDVPNFIRRFKVRYGRTPTQLRSELAKNSGQA